MDAVDGRTQSPTAGAAVRCDAADYHSPLPLRYVWHLVQPAECGGHITPGNLVQLCDSCHASVHLMLWQIANGGLTVPRPNARQLAIARAGYQACEAAGTTGHIPQP